MTMLTRCSNFLGLQHPKPLKRKLFDSKNQGYMVDQYLLSKRLQKSLQKLSAGPDPKDEPLY